MTRLFWIVILFQSWAMAQSGVALSADFKKVYLCEIWADQPNPQILKFEVQTDSLLSCLEKVLLEDEYEKIKSAWAGRKFVSEEDLKAQNITAKIDINNFKMDLDFPMEWQQPHIEAVRDEDKKLESEDRAANFSAYLNYAVNANYSSLETDSNVSKDIQLNPVIATQGVVVESYHTYHSLIGETKRLDTFLTKDFESSLVRLRLGDNTSSPGPLYDTNRYLGIKVSREFGISPGFVKHPLGEREIFLETPSRVEIFVNGLLIKVLNLDAGRHSLRDIPTNQGLNDISVKITDASGQTRYINFQMAAEESLLKKGINDFSFGGGKLTDDTFIEPQYLEKTFASILFRRGMTTFWTPEISVLGVEGNLIESVGSLFATTVGIFRIDAAFSQTRDFLGNAMRAGYVWTSEKGSRQQRFSIGGETFSPKYLKKLFPGFFAETTNRWTAYANFSSSITETVSGQISANVNRAFINDAESLQTIIQANKRFGSNLTTSFYYSEMRNYGATPDLIHELGINLSYHFDDHVTMLANARYPSQGSQQVQGDVLYNNADNNSAAQATFSETADGNTAGLAGSYGWQYADLAAGMNHNDDFRGGRVTRYRLNPSGSIVFADGILGLGRYIRDSYTLLSNERDEYIYLNGDENQSEINVPPMSAGVLTTTQAYQLKVLNVGRSTQDDIKTGEIYHREFKARPKYKTAAILKVEEEKLFAIRGQMKNAKGVIIGYVAGRIMNLETKNEFKFFTDGDGTFYIESLSPGRYEVIVYGDPFEVLEFNLAQARKGINEIGVLQLSPRYNSNVPGYYENKKKE
jgi:outer membrane usher protein